MYVKAGVYLQTGRVPHPYHAYNSAYNPVSRLIKYSLNIIF